MQSLISFPVGHKNPPNNLNNFSGNKAKTNVFNVTFFIPSKNVYKIWYFLNPHWRLFLKNLRHFLSNFNYLGQFATA